jgi:short-subunit dehydrogenase
MSKFALRAFADALRGELRPSNVGVTLINPGFVDSEIRLVNNKGLHSAKTNDQVPSWLLMPADVAARQIVKSVARRQNEKVITFHGKLAVILARHFPTVVSWTISKMMKRKQFSFLSKKEQVREK